jgi:hypothetical protein
MHIALAAGVVAASVLTPYATRTDAAASDSSGSAGIARAAQLPSTAAVAQELRGRTQRLLDAIAPGDVAVWDELLDPDVIQVDEDDVVRRKAAILAELKPLGPGLTGHLNIDEFSVARSGDVAVVTHEDDETLDYHGQMILSRFRMTDTWHLTANGWRLLGSQVLAVQKDPQSVTLDTTTLCGYAGTYAMAADVIDTIRCSGDHLVVSRRGRPDREFKAEIKDVFFESGQPRTRRIFVRDADGRLTGFVDRREARDVVWKRNPG